MQFRSTLALSAALFAAPAFAGDQVLLVQETGDDICYVLSTTDGSIVTTFDASFSSTGIAWIDGPDGTLLLSDQIGDTIWQTDADGTNERDFITAEIDNIRGIDRFGSFTVGATADGLFAWDANGDILPDNVSDNLFDVLPAPGNLFITASLDTDNLVAYNVTGTEVGSTTPGGVDFPEQISFIDDNGTTRVATASFSADAVFIFNLDGSLDRSLPLTTNGRGVNQLDNGNLIISTNAALEVRDLDGNLVTTIAEDGGFRFIHRSSNWVSQ